MEQERRFAVTVSDGKQAPRVTSLTVTSDSLFLSDLSAETVPIITNKVRTVKLRRNRVTGLGISIKGGKEHNLPILISKIYRDTAKEGGQLFVGDAILKVNEKSLEEVTHQEAVDILRLAGSIVQLQIKHLRSASRYLKQCSERGSLCMGPSDDSRRHLPLLFACVTRYLSGTDRLRERALEVFCANGQQSGIIICPSDDQLDAVFTALQERVDALNFRAINENNRLFLSSDQISYVGWYGLREATEARLPTWVRRFIALKGAELYVFQSPPQSSRDWVRCDSRHSLYECVLRILHPQQYLDDRQFCILISTADAGNLYLGGETREQLEELQRHWFRATCHAVLNLKKRSFGCTFEGTIVVLTLDVAEGVALQDNTSGKEIWKFRFSQLKGSADDGNSMLKLHFHNEETAANESKELFCQHLPSLLHTLHAFLTAKLALLDPEYELIE